VVGEATVFDVVFTDHPVIDYRAMLAADGAALEAVNAQCPRHGVLEGQETLDVGPAHTDEDVARAPGVFEAALATLPRRSRTAP
jgi:hypothetical protein